MTASFEEKSAWVQLAAILVGMGAYLVIAGQLLASGVRHTAPFTALFAVAVVGLVLILIAGHAAAAATSRPEPPDERDRLIAWRAEHHASWLLGAGAILAIACLALGVENVWTANLLVLALAASEALAMSLRILWYRRGL